MHGIVYWQTKKSRASRLFEQWPQILKRLFRSLVNLSVLMTLLISGINLTSVELFRI